MPARHTTEDIMQLHSDACLHSRSQDRVSFTSLVLTPHKAQSFAGSPGRAEEQKDLAIGVASPRLWRLVH